MSGSCLALLLGSLLTALAIASGLYAAQFVGSRTANLAQVVTGQRVVSPDALASSTSGARSFARWGAVVAHE